MDQQKHIEKNKHKWDKWAPVADTKRWKYDYLRKGQKFVIDMAAPESGIRLLDIGCGTGWALGEASRAISNKGDFYGVDISQEMITKASQNFRGSDNFHFIRADSEKIPLESNFFDIIICTNSFHHYFHPEKAMGEISRLLKPGGRVFILDPAADSILIKLIDRIIRIIDRAHVKIYSSEEFENLMKSSGLKYLGNREFLKYNLVQIGEK